MLERCRGAGSIPAAEAGAGSRCRVREKGDGVGKGGCGGGGQGIAGWHRPHGGVPASFPPPHPHLHPSFLFFPGERYREGGEKQDLGDAVTADVSPPPTPIKN